MIQTSLQNQRRALLVLLAVMVGGVYMLTYSARIESNDTRFMFDATASLVRFGDFRQDLTHGNRRFWDYDTPLPTLPLLTVDAEPLQIILSAPLYWLADTVPGIGRVHLVWLFNVFVTTAGVGLFYVYALQLGYRVAVAFLTAALLGLGTILWPYSKTFFQEPLTLLLILLTAYCLERWRSGGYPWRWLLTSGGVLALALLARRGAAVALPTLAVIAFPWTDRLFARRGVRWAFFGAVILVGGLLYYNSLPQSAQEIGQFYRNEAYLESIPWFERTERAAMNQGVQGYLFSIGGSVWGTSPVVLLALPGCLILAASGRMRYVVALWTTLLVYVLVYAYVTRFDWFGGLSWPPRFLVSTVPFLMLCALPAVDWLLGGKPTKWRRVAWAGAGVLVAYSLWIQFNAVSYWWGDYAALLPPEADGFTEWAGGLNDPRYLRWTLLPSLWGTVPFDFAWVRTGVNWLTVPFALLSLSAGAGAAWILRTESLTRRAWWAVYAAPILLLVAIGVGMRAIYQDDLYLAFSDGLRDVVPLIRQEMQADEILLIGELGHERYFLNYGRLPNRIISLTEHPGEQPSPEQPPEVTSSNPAALIERPTAQLIDTLATEQVRVWILSDSSPFIPWSVLPLERYMTAYHYPLAAYDTTGDDGLPVRLLAYYAGAHHDPFTLAGPDDATDLRFGGDVRLLGYTAPHGAVYAPGDIIPVSLMWAADAPLETDYRVALHLAQPGVGVAASALDSPPAAGFSPTTEWTPGVPVWDNRAIQLPPGIAPGSYELWVALYAAEPLTVSGTSTAEDRTLGVLPLEITVRPRN